MNPEPRPAAAARTVGALALASIVTFALLGCSQPSPAPTGSTRADSNSITEIPPSPAATATGAESSAPWAAPADASARTAAAGLPMLSSEGTELHIHSHLVVTIDGKFVALPADIGIDVAKQRISPLHTHDSSGIVHVESPVASTFTLGQFFTEWDVALDATRIGGYSTTGGHSLTAFVDGVKFSGNPASIVFANHQNIDIVYGPADETAAPSAPFAWPDGY
ncbi:hypothetical protein [Lacisediminihabitans profunda]|uniref:Uncharacterized protein n=1 Tax=Lacisediminihabitans profunda TaxID=2594790 RepID=A0A5C8UUD9_9MICO|nr:hypothetical protein [Lacisediminihabitans profunda]TXN31256.1 hypothetical protein FVP33_06720 [Lacisediminihabitans profunda]